MVASRLVDEECCAGSGVSVIVDGTEELHTAVAKAADGCARVEVEWVEAVAEDVDCSCEIAGADCALTAAEDALGWLVGCGATATGILDVVLESSGEMTLSEQEDTTALEVAPVGITLGAEAVDVAESEVALREEVLRAAACVLAADAIRARSRESRAMLM